MRVKFLTGEKFSTMKIVDTMLEYENRGLRGQLRKVVKPCPVLSFAVVAGTKGRRDETNKINLLKK